MATNCAPHNLVEVVQALRHLIKHPKADARRPDAVRARPRPAHRRQDRRPRRHPRRLRDRPRHRSGCAPPPASRPIGRRKAIVVTELPYGVGIEKVVERIKTLVQGKKLQGIADVKDLTDREPRAAPGHRGQERLRPRGAARAALPPDAAGGLLRHQRRRPGRRPAAHPRPQGAARGLPAATATTSCAAARRSAAAKAADRLHLVEGLLVAILDIDEVIQLIRACDNAAEARERLMTRLRPHRAAGRLHPRHGAAPADPVLAGSSSRRSRPSCGARSRRSTRSSATRPCCARSSPTSSPRSPRPTAPRGARCCSSRPAPRSPPPPPRSRSPTTRASRCCRPAGCWPAPASAEPVGHRRGPRQPRRRRLGRARPPRAARSACSPRPGGCCALGVLDLPTIPPTRQRPQPPGRAAAHRDALAGAPASGRWRCARWPPTGPGWRSAPATASSSGSTPRCSAATSGR